MEVYDNAGKATYLVEMGWVGYSQANAEYCSDTQYTRIQTSGEFRVGLPGVKPTFGELELVQPVVAATRGKG